LKEMNRLARVHKMDFSHIYFRLHSANPVGVQNMRYILQDNGWTEIDNEYFCKVLNWLFSCNAFKCIFNMF
jgi:hypothetical protein